MKARLAILFIVTFFFISLDVYILDGFYFITGNKKFRLFTICYIIVQLLAYAGILLAPAGWGKRALTLSRWRLVLQGFGMTILAVKILLVFLLLTQDLARLAGGTGLWLYGLMSESYDHPWIPLQRNVYLISSFLVFSGLFLTAMVHGITRGKYNYSVEKISLKFPNLPPGLLGLRIVHISDIHAGSLDSLSKVRKGIAMIRQQKPDIVLFTGDLVNFDKDEIDPFIDLFAKLKAPLGKFAVLGNHDYYGSPRNPTHRQAYWNDFKRKYESMGFDLLLNQHRRVIHNNASFVLVGVENWGEGRWFPKRGQLDVALKGVEPEEFVILLSHDPTHWEHKVINHQRHIPITLSGHTHGMQFGINWPFFKWSPVQYRYKRWSGLYKEKDRILYVNRGFGFLGFPGRIGMWPEITVIELSDNRQSNH